MMGNIVSLSGGKDSTAMLHKLLEAGEDITAVIFCDTGFEFPEMYDHLEKVKHNTGLTITTVHPYEPLEYMMCRRKIKKGKRKGENGYGWPRPGARWCTEYKNAAIRKAVRRLDGIECVGIAVDEKRTIREGKRYPLIELGMTEADCLEYCYSLGYDWGGLYDHMSRVSCYICPLQSLRELEYIYRYRQELWQKMQYLDCNCYNTFRIKESLRELERRFNESSNCL